MSLSSRPAAPAPYTPLTVDVSPYRDEADFSAIPAGSALDPVSIADLLRNAFVYPPHSILRDVKLAGVSFDMPGECAGEPRLRCDFPSMWPPSPGAANAADEAQLAGTYHQLLCQSVARSTRGMRAPWLLQSGGKDSTSLAIALAEVRADTTCLTYLGGPEENEVASARAVARKLGLRHESLVCDPARAYDRYLKMVPRMPLLSADFAALSYADLAWEVHARGGDGMLDGLGSDPYFGMPTHGRKRLAGLLARGWRVPRALFHAPLVRNSFGLCFALASLEMDHFERDFPGSRFSDGEVDELLGQPLAARSRARRDAYAEAIGAAPREQALHEISLTLIEGACLAKGMYAAAAMALRLAYPYCDEALRAWVARELPARLRVGPDGTNKVLVRRHIARYFGELPYVSAKGSFRFDLCGLARHRFDRVHAFAREGRDLLPGASAWLERHRDRLDNKYFASKFYLLAVLLPWLLSRAQAAHRASDATASAGRECRS